MSSRYHRLVILNLLGFIAVLTVNYLANSLPLNGKTPGQLSDQYPNLFVPAGLTFAIWGAIYLILSVWMALQVVGLFNPTQRMRIEPAVENVGQTFIFSCLFNIAWLFSWHWERIGLSVFVMVLLLATLVSLNERTGNGREKINLYEKWGTHTAFGLYQGWITVALIANTTAWLVASGWQGFGISAPVWAVLMIVAGSGIAIYITWSRNMIFHGLAVIWALYGICLKREAVGDAPDVLHTARACMSILSVVVLLRVGRWLRY